jgi:long-chain acyl-CoA synthetase
VAFYWSNSIETVTLFFGSWKAGLIVVPINVRLKAAELAYVLGHSEPSICFVQPELAAVAHQALEIGGSKTPVQTSLPELVSDLSGTLPEVNESDTSVILYTSGTTARPKGVAHTHRSLLGGARLMLAMIGDAGAVSMATTQMAHASGLICLLLPSILDGKTTVLMPSFDPSAALDNIERFGVTYTGALPAMATLMMQEQQHRPRNVRSLKTFAGGGDSVPIALQDEFAAIFGLPILELLAMTESCPMCWNPADDLKPGTVGKARAGVEFRIVGLDGAEGKAGELVVRSPANFREYWRDAESTAAVLSNGWLHTGDLVQQDAEGYLQFTGRLKHIIIRGGSNIAPPEVEEAFYHHPAVREAAVAGLPDPLYGQKVAAFVVLREGFSADENELCDFARERLADYKVPEVIRFLPELPKGLTGKVDRRKLAELAS